jgi:SCY1-like protein 2
MGSSLFPNYTLEKKPYLVLKYWKIFKGVNKASGENISAFIFEKKELDKKNEKDKTNILFCLRKEPETLIRGKNKHKNFLKVIESLKEDNDSMGFITEYVNYNLITWANIYQPSKLEIKYIIYQLLSVVIFMHSEYHISHNNLNLDNIFITENNFVKITGFMFTTTLNNNNSNNSNNINLKKNLIEACCDMKYIAPELVLNNEISNSSDSFIIGLISYYLLGEKSNNDLFILTDNSYDSYKNTYKNTNIEKKINAFNNDLIKDYLKSLLQNNTEKRKNLSLIQNSKFFVESEDNSKLVPLCLLSKMESAEITNNYDLLKLLPNILDLYSIKEKEFLILPNLLYYLKIENLINPIVPALFLLSETTNNEINFEKKIWPTFKALFNMKKFPAITLYFTLKKVSFLINNLEKSEFNNHCIPLICKALDCGVQKIQDVILEELPKILKNIDKNEFQNKIYNRLVKIVIQTKNQKLRKKIMNFFIYLSDYFDSYFINNNFLDDIEKIIKSETTLNICKNAFTLYEKMKTKVNDKSVRSKIIPSLLLMMCNGEISEELFNKGENIIHSYIQKIKEKRKEQFLQDIENDSDANNSNKNINVIKKAEGNNKNISSPLSVARSKSTLSGNISLFGNSSEDSGLDLEQKKRSKKEKEKEKIKANKNKKELNNENNNLFDNLLNNNNEDMDNKNVDSSFDSISTGKNKNEFDLANKKEFLSSLKLKRIEKQQKLENKNTAGKTNTFNENKKNGWEEIESDDENTDELGKYIIKPKKSSEGKNNKKESDKKKSNRKKWDEEEEEDNDDNLNYKKNESESDFSKEKNKNENKKNEEIFHLNFDDYNNSIAVNPINTYLYDNIVNNNDMEKKEEIADNKNESIKDNNNDKDENNKKKIKKKKKHKKKDKDKTEDNKEKETKEAISTTKMRMNERAKNLDLDSLLDDD